MIADITILLVIQCQPQLEAKSIQLGTVNIVFEASFKMYFQFITSRK